MCGVEGSRPQPLTQASALKETESGEARAALTIYAILWEVLTCGLCAFWGADQRSSLIRRLEGASGVPGVAQTKTPRRENGHQ